MAVSYQKSCHLHSSGDNSLQSCPSHHGTRLCTNVRLLGILQGVGALIWATKEDQGASRYPANKAAGQWEVWGWQVGHGALLLPGVPEGTGWVREGGGSTVKSKCSQKHSLASNSSNTMSPVSPMHRPAELTASSVSLRLFPGGCRLQPSPRAPVTSNHDSCKSPILVLPHRGFQSLCCSPQPENNLGPRPLPSRTCPRGTRGCRAVKPAPKQLLLPLLPTPQSQTMARVPSAPATMAIHAHPPASPKPGAAAVSGAAPAPPRLPRDLPQAVTQC